MNHKYQNHCLIIVLLVFYLLFSISCITPSKINYFQKSDKKGKAEFFIKQVEYAIQCGDNLYIMFSSTEPLTNQILSNEIANVPSLNLSAKYKHVYLVNNQGFITVPQLGKVYVENMTLEQLKDSLESDIKKYFTQVTVDVRLADNYVTIIGAVNSPGRYMVDFRDKISIFDLLGMAGDLKYEANRKEVKLLRKIGKDSIIMTPLNLTKRNIIEEPYYYLMPNDIVYVENLKAVTFGEKSYPFASTLALILSVTTSILVISSYIK